ncbi:polyphenol oxidase family protein [Leptospira yasudae]|uniref:polyphenol oxidase family protein n=1 Tax=Leptospira yasudae TaxID=2202201 RepID=UPI0010915E0A|nr:polyphenol oxidase family protein [Leptospira yasudae]MBW0434727.1 polyphenol oxidase family protein [Leptospira yasudae]TGM96376.1 laccase domain-containing protein [Leptospira yasudae]
MAIFHSFPIAEGKKIKILIAGKKDLPNESLDLQTQKREIAKLTGVSESNVFILDQVHGDTVFDADRSDASSFEKGDAWIGEASGKILCIKTADCMPLFFWSEQSPKFVAIHSGWKGTLAGITEKTLRLAFDRSILSNGTLLGYLGPCASGLRYEVGEDVALLFREEFPNCLQETKPGKFLLDLESFLKFRLEKNGISVVLQSERICTMEKDSDFFSHRQTDVGRNLNLIWKEG